MSQKATKPLATVQSELERVQAQLTKDERFAGLSESELQRRALTEEAAKRLQHDTNDMRQALIRPECRRVLFRIIEESKCFAGSFVQGKPDQTAYNEGQRSIGIYVYTLAEAAEPGSCLKMAREAESERAAAQARHKKILEAANG